MTPQEKRYLQALGDEVRSQRKFLGLSQKQLADKLDLTWTTIQNLEQCRQMPSLTTILKLADGLGLYPSELLRAAELRDDGDPLDMSDAADRLARAKEEMKDQIIATIKAL